MLNKMRNGTSGHEHGRVSVQIVWFSCEEVSLAICQTLESLLPKHPNLFICHFHNILVFCTTAQVLRSGDLGIRFWHAMFQMFSDTRYNYVYMYLLTFILGFNSLHWTISFTLIVQSLDSTIIYIIDIYDLYHICTIIDIRGRISIFVIPKVVDQLLT